MDWNALGTWMAVVVALGLAMKDTLIRSRERTAHHLLVAAAIRPLVAQTTNALTQTRTLAQQALTSGSDVGALRSCCNQFLNISTSYGLGDVRGYADQVGALPEPTLIPLVKAMVVLNMLAHNGRIEQQAQWGHNLPAVRATLEEWIEQASSVLTSLEWVERGLEKLMSSPRWRNPEIYGA
jgi:hypothetical protein